MKTGNVPRRFATRFNSLILIGVFIILAAVVAVPFYSARSSSLVTSSAATALSNNSGQSNIEPFNGVSQRILSFGSTLLPLSAPLVPPVTESINTYKSDCMTPEVHFTTGDTVCVKVTSVSPYSTSIYWVNPDGAIVQRDAANTNASRAVSQVGKWGAYLVGFDNEKRDVAFFSVSDPQLPAVDLSVFKNSGGNFIAGGLVTYTIIATNNGPDTANTVKMVEATPNNTTFGSEAQNSGPIFTCTPGTGNTTCTIDNLAAGASASFTFFYQIDAGTAVGTVISNTVTLTSSTTELHADDNTWTDSHVVTGTSGAAGCSVACPEGITTTANTTQNNQPGAIVHFTPPAGSTECGVITVDHCNDCFFPVGTTTVTGSATTGESCSFNVVVNPPNPGAPMITCPADQTANADSNCAATLTIGNPTVTGDNVTFSGVRSDGKPLYNCDCYPADPNNPGVECEITGACTRRADASFGAGVTTITWTAYSHDIAGPYPDPLTEEAHRTGSASCTQTMTVNDVTPPTITPPPDQTASADANCQAAVPDFTQSTTVTDNCACASSDTSDTCQGRERITVTQDPAPGTVVGPGTYTITLTANDGSSNNDGQGNTSTAHVTFTVKDTTAPIITCPANITTNTDPGLCAAAVVTGTATATDNCDSNPTITGTRSDSQPLVAPYPVGTTTITWTATDSSNNSSSCTQTVTVNDTEKPTIVCPANITTGTDPGVCSATVNPGSPTATDNCSVTVTGTRSDGQPLNAPYPKGTTTITWTATDPSGNSASCTQTVTVNDTEAPVITTNGQTPVLWPPNHEYHTFNVTDFVTSVSDNCDTIAVSSVVIDKVTSDEVENGPGSGDTLNDIVIASDCKSVQLRAERENNADGRVYTITFKVTDSAGNVGIKTARVHVPKNLGVPVVDSGPHYTVTGTCP